MEGTTGFHRINVADIDRLNGLAPIGHLCIALLNNSIEDLSAGIAKSTAEYCTYSHVSTAGITQTIAECPNLFPHVSQSRSFVLHGQRCQYVYLK